MLKVVVFVVGGGGAAAAVKVVLVRPCVRRARSWNPTEHLYSSTTHVVGNMNDVTSTGVLGVDGA